MRLYTCAKERGQQKDAGLLLRIQDNASPGSYSKRDYSKGREGSRGNLQRRAADIAEDNR